MHPDRRTRLRDRLAQGGLDALLVTTPVNIRYLTGFTGSAGSLLVTAKDQVLATDPRYAEQAAAEAPDVDVVVTGEGDWLADRAGPGQRVGLESHRLAWDTVRSLAKRLGGAAVVPAPDHVETLREAKDEGEIAALARACAATDAAFSELLDWLKPGMTELQVAAGLHYGVVTHGADDRGFDAIVAAGPNSARPHHRPGRRAIEAGDVVKVDFGAVTDGYHSDMSRTIVVGEPPAWLGSVHDLVRRAQEAAVAAVAAGISAGAVDEVARATISDAGYGAAFTHGTGHGIGLEIHESPILRRGADATLDEGMAITVEPGVYLPGRGGVRIEDTVVVGSDHATVLTGSRKDLLVL